MFVQTTLLGVKDEPKTRSQVKERVSLLERLRERLIKASDYSDTGFEYSPYLNLVNSRLADLKMD